MNAQKLSVGFLIFPDFPMACLTSMIEPLRAANEIAGQDAFHWTIVSEDGGKITSSAKVSFEPDCALNTLPEIDILFLLSSPSSRFENPKSGNGILSKKVRHGMSIGGISGGVFPLVRSGLMHNHPVSVHWCYEAAFREEFQDVSAEDDVIVTGQNRYTAAGAAAAFDLALQFIDDRLGGKIAHEVACWFQHPLMRGAGVRQRVPIEQNPQNGDSLPDVIVECVKIFAERMDDPVSIVELSERIGLSARQLGRLFKQATNQSPTQFYRDIRMKYARQLVVYSQMSLTEVAAAVGYGTSTSLGIHYKEAFGLSPKEDRSRINRFRVKDNAPVPTMQDHFTI